jgi:hypothetical protein
MRSQFLDREEPLENALPLIFAPDIIFFAPHTVKLAAQRRSIGPFRPQVLSMDSPFLSILISEDFFFC